MQRAALVPGIWGTGWGALIKHAHLNIHWAAMQLPVFLLDYVIVHELTQRPVPHPRAVWGRVERAMPDYKRRIARPATTGAAWRGPPPARDGCALDGPGHAC